MELIILNDGLYQLIPVTKEILGDIKLFNEIDCFDLCDILRKTNWLCRYLKLTYNE